MKSSSVFQKSRVATAVGRALVLLSLAAGIEQAVEVLTRGAGLRGEEGRAAQIPNTFSSDRLDEPRLDKSRLATTPNRDLTSKTPNGVADPETLRLQFVLGEEKSLLRAATSERETNYELPSRREIEELVMAARSLLKRGKRFGVEIQAEIVLSRLSDLLLAPVQGELLTKTRVEIFADGVLRQLPFAALPLPVKSLRPEVPAPAGRQPLLVDGHEISLHTPRSIGSRRLSLSAHVSPSRTIAVFADPVYGVDDPRLRHRQNHEIERTSGSNGRGTGMSSVAFSRLNFSAAEAASILALVPPSQASVAVGFDANRDRVLGGDLRDFRILHFAAHAVVDPGRGVAPLALVLSTVDAAGRPRDGLLTAHDIEQIQLSADLVVLSACQTALGQESQDKGPTGLARAFLDSGTRRVVVSLWEVEDRATAELMSRFYHSLLQDGLAPAAALQQAQRSMRYEPAWRSPFFWSGFVVQGDLTGHGDSPTCRHRLLTDNREPREALLPPGKWVNR